MLYKKVITLIILLFYTKRISLHCVFHGIRLLRLREIGCRETINFLCTYFNNLQKRYSV